MKIRIVDSSDLAVQEILVHGSKRDTSGNYATGPVGDMTFVGPVAYQVARHIRAEAVQVFLRDNIAPQLHFAAARIFPGRAAAFRWAASHPHTVRREDQLWVDIDNRYRIKLLDGVLVAADATPEGRNVTIRYQYLYGAERLITL